MIALWLTKQEQRLYDIIASANGISRQGLTERLWSNRADGGPVSGAAHISVLINKVNKKLTAERIKRSHDGLYRIVKESADVTT